MDMRHIGTADSSRITPVPNDDLELRLTTLEHEVTRLREETAAARALAALADRDVAEFRTELRGHHHVLEARRETQLEQGQKIAEQGQKLDDQGRDMREGFATLATGMAQITALLTRIGGRSATVAEQELRVPSGVPTGAGAGHPQPAGTRRGPAACDMP